MPYFGQRTALETVNVNRIDAVIYAALRIARSAQLAQGGEEAIGYSGR